MFDFINNERFPLFFAGGISNGMEDYIIENDGLRLQSYANEKKVIIKRCEKGLQTFMDSGAFSASMKGIDINVDEYIDFCNKYKDNLYLYCQFDTIPVEGISGDESAQKTIENYYYMKNKLIEPDKLLYVFHYGEPFKYLEEMLNKDEKIKYIALGGLVRKRKKHRREFMQKAFEIIKNSKNPDVKVHAFGMTCFDLLEEFPFTSADSTTWIHCARFGQIQTQFGDLTISDRRPNEKNHFNKLTQEQKTKVIQEIENQGFTIDQLSTDYKKRMQLKVQQWLKWTKEYKYKGEI